MKLVYILLGLLLTISLATATADYGGKNHGKNEPSHYFPYPNHHPLPCGPVNHCNYGEVCHIVKDSCTCSPHPDHHNPHPTRTPGPTITPVNSAVYLSQRLIGSWQDGSRGNKWYSQWDVTIHNTGNRNIKEIYLSTDYTFRLRDNSDSSLWNMVRLGNGILGLPSYQNSINAGATYVFGFIIEGRQPANIQILKIVYQ